MLEHFIDILNKLQVRKSWANFWENFLKSAKKI